MTISFGGLFSELDTNSIVEQLVELKKTQLITPLQTKITTVQDKQTAMATVQLAISNFASTITSLQDSQVTTMSASVGSSSKIAINTVDDDAIAGESYSIYVDTLATTDKVYYNGVADKTTTTFGTGTVSITSAGVTKNVTIDGSNNTLQGIADAINATSGINVTASIVDDGDPSNPYRLVLTSKFQGESGDITTDLASVLTLTTDAALTATNDATDASVRINGLTATSDDNVFDGAIPGVKFTVSNTETTTPITLTVTKSASPLKSAIEDMVTTYNTLNTTFRSQFLYNESTQSAGILSSDFALQSIQSNIKNTLFGLASNAGNLDYKSLASLGLNLGDNGVLIFNEEKFDAAYTDDPDQLDRLMFGNDSTNFTGIFEQLGDYLDTTLDETSGVFTNKNDAYDATVENYNERIANYSERIFAYQQLLKTKFLYMEQNIARFKSQEASLESFQNTLDSISGKNS